MKERISRIGIVGGGSWGTALAVHCGVLDIPVGLWVHEEELVRRMNENRENDVYLPGVVIPPAVEATHDFEECLAGAAIVMSVVPSHLAREVWKEAHSYLPVDAVLVNATKGIEETSFLTSSGVLAESIGGNVSDRMVTLSGPTFADEVARQLPAAAVLASSNLEIARRVQMALKSDSLRLYTNKDPVGVEIAASLKNVMAIAAGVMSTTESPRRIN